MDTQGTRRPRRQLSLSSGRSRLEIQAEGESRCLTRAVCHRLASGARRSVPLRRDWDRGRPRRSTATLLPNHGSRGVRPAPTAASSRPRGSRSEGLPRLTAPSPGRDSSPFLGGHVLLALTVTQIPKLNRRRARSRCRVGVPASLVETSASSPPPARRNPASSPEPLSSADAASP